jgi:hypothetical protein
MSKCNENRPGYKKTKVGWVPNSWEICPFDDFFKRVRKKVDVEPDIEYQEIGIRSHGKGIFHKNPTTGLKIGSKSVFWVEESALIFNIVFAWERAVAITAEKELGMIASPPFSEQKKIAEILSTWDNAIEQLRKLINAKRRLKKALMQQLLTGKKRLPGFGKSKDRNSYRFFDIPAEWKCSQIREIAEECSERYTQHDKLTVLSCSKRFGFVESSEYFGKQVFSENTSNYKVIRRGCFGYPSNHIEEGSIGLLLSHDVGIVSPIYTVFKCDDLMVPDFLYALFKTDTYRHIFSISTNSSVDRRGSLRWREFSLIQVPNPPKEEQQAIVNVLQAADNENTLFDKKLKALEKQKRGLMQKLLAGEIRVNVDK